MSETWTVSKPALVSEGGLVAAQNPDAAAAGAAILRDGGSAVDAAVATAFALAAREPWMSGLGGGGFMLVARPGEPVEVVDFAMVAARRLDPARYALVDGPSPNLFGFPAVTENRNLEGYESILVPGSVDGLGLAHERHGRLAWHHVLAPAIALAEDGLPVDWYATLSIAAEAAALRRHSPESYLVDGLPPVDVIGGGAMRLPFPHLADTLRRIAEEGRRVFYEGSLARDLVADLAAGGSAIAADDLAGYHARIVEPLSFAHGDAVLHAVPGRSGGPTFRMALDHLTGALSESARGRAPGPDGYLALAEALTVAFHSRLTEGVDAAPGAHTTHLSVVHADGTMVALTNTLLNRFGSKVVLPRTGILMNNGMAWFDPRPDRPNAIAPGIRPLANMCPWIATRDGRPVAAVGASGGRKIIAAMVQLAAFLVDCAMPAEAAWHAPRLDTEGDGTIRYDPRLDPAAVAAIAERFTTVPIAGMAFPSPFAVPQGVVRPDPGGPNIALAHPYHPRTATART